MPFSTNKGVKTFYEVAGEGPPMVMLHGSTWDHTLWLYQMAHFSTWFRCIAPDVRCFGRSDKVTTPFTYQDVVADLISVLEQEDVIGAILLGGSLGSRLSVSLAHAAPDRIAAAVVYGANTQASPEGKSDADKRRLERIRRYREGDLGEAYKWQLTRGLTDDFKASSLGQYVVEMMMEKVHWLNGPSIPNLYEAASKNDLQPLLPEIQVPFLVVSGEYDDSLELARDTARRLANAQHRVLKDTGQHCGLENPAGFDALVIEFLSEQGLMPKA